MTFIKERVLATFTGLLVSTGLVAAETERGSPAWDIAREMGVNGGLIICVGEADAAAELARSTGRQGRQPNTSYRSDSTFSLPLVA